MEKESIVLCDTNIIIEFYKENPAIVKSLEAIGQQNIAISIITAGELTSSNNWSGSAPPGAKKWLESGVKLLSLELVKAFLWI